MFRQLLKPVLRRNLGHSASLGPGIRVSKYQCLKYAAWTVAGTGVYGAYSFNTRVRNDQLKVPSEDQTFEMGLYRNSRKELAEIENIKRQTKSSNFFVRALIRLGYFIEDYVLSPSATFLRFFELGAIFVPLLMAYPLMIYLGPRQKHLDNERLGKILWNRLLKFAIELAGPCFIKLGQWAGLRTDIFSRNLCDELSALHSNSKPHSFHATKKIVCRSFGVDNFDELFDEFVKKPIGVGSIAQVYVAKISERYLEKLEEPSSQEHPKGRKGLIQSKISELKKLFYEALENFSPYHSMNNPKPNQWVAVKVLHPNVEVKIMRDLKLMSFFARAIDYIPTMEWLSLPEEVEQFSTFMKLQLDLRIEGMNLNKFIENFGLNEIKKKYNMVGNNKFQIKFSKPYLGCSSREVLVEEYLHAVPIAIILKLTDIAKQRLEKDPNLKEEKNFMKLNKVLSTEILDSFLQMLILDNFIHSDLHPGNIFVRFYNNSNPQQLPEDDQAVLKDMSLITNDLLEKSHDDCLQVFSRLYEKGYKPEVCYLDTGLVTELNDRDRINFLELFGALTMFDGYKAGELMVERSRSPETVTDKDIFALKVQRIVDTVKQRTFTLGNVSIGDLLDQVLSMVRQHHVKLEPDFVNVIVAIFLLEGIGRLLNPDLDIFARFVLATLDYDVFLY